VDAVGHLVDVRQVVADRDHRQAAVTDVADELPHPLALLDAECGRRLVDAECAVGSSRITTLLASIGLWMCTRSPSREISPRSGMSGPRTAL
jgi:hypothetical protein